MTDQPKKERNRKEQREARLIKAALDVPYTMALRLLRTGECVVVDGVVQQKDYDLPGREV